MKAATLTFIRQRFTEYYEKNRLSPPSSVGQREFGFIFFDGDYPEDIRMRRHIGFATPDEMQEYVRILIPAHAYYSVAYYGTPNAPTMGEKGWLGADLIFDLDADHLMRGSYQAMLDRIKEEAVKLVGVLTSELGIDPRQMKLIFSGGRGYHIHVHEIAFRSYTSQERRELVDYICGTGIDPGILADWKTGRPGWHERLRVALLGYLTGLSEKPGKEAVRDLTAFRGIGETRATRFMEMTEGLIADLKTRPDRINLKDQTYGSVLETLLTEKDSPLAGLIREAGIQADEPVTTDIRRLIRLPGSLHAKSGFRTTPVALKELDAFDPLIDGVAFGDRPVRIDAAGEYTVPLLGNTWQITKGTQQVPEAVALFLCCRGMAEIGGDPRAS